MVRNAPADVTTQRALTDLVGELKEEWRDGTRPDAVGAARDHPALLEHRTLMIDLAYEEYCLREEAGETPEIDSFCRKFPAHRSYLREVLDGHRQLVDHPGLSTRPEAAFPVEGGTFDGLTIVRELGRGAFARVYLVTDPKTGDRPLVLKLSRRPSAEGRTLGANEHDHVVPIYWARNVDGFFAVCMPLVGTTTLRDVIERITAAAAPHRCGPILDVIRGDLARIPFSVRQHPSLIRDRQRLGDGIVAIAAPLARALAYLHRNGVCHGDLKPSNVLLGPGSFPYLIDFNLSTGQDDSALRVGGTLAYMAPERVRLLVDSNSERGPADRSDIYSFGAVLFECLTGKVPFAPADNLELRAAALELWRRQTESRPRIKAADPRIPTVLADLVDACLATDPTHRPSADQVARVLTRYTHRRALRTRLFVAAAGVAIAAVLLYLVLTRPAPKAGTEPAGGDDLAQLQALDPFARGIEFLRQNEIALAMKCFNDARQQNGDGRTFAYIGYCNARSGNHQVAADSYAEATARGYGPAWVHSGRAYSLSHLPNDPANLPEAMREASIARDSARDDRGVEFNWAIIRYLTRQDHVTKRLDDPECIEAVRTVMAAGPQDADLCYKAALILASSSSDSDQMQSEAITYLRRAVELGRPAGPLSSSPVFARFLAKHPDFEKLVEHPPAGHAVNPLQLELVRPPL